MLQVLVGQRPLEHARQERRAAAHVVGQSPGEHLVGHDSRREQVGRDGGRPAQEELRRHVPERAGGAALRVIGHRDPEIDDLDLLAVDEHVRRLEIVVDDVPAVQVRERPQELDPGARLFFDRPISRRGEDVARRGQHLHREVGAPGVVEAVVVDADDVRVMQRRESLEFAREDEAPIAPGAELLQGHRLLRQPVGGLVDDPCPALANHPPEDVRIGQHALRRRRRAPGEVGGVRVARIDLCRQDAPLWRMNRRSGPKSRAAPG